MIHRLSRNEFKILQAVGRYRDTYGYGPSYPEIELSTGLCRSMVHMYVHRLIAKGYLTHGLTKRGNMAARSLQYGEVQHE
jgi:DNA-binding IclR family transcriptional regulator